MKQLKQIRYEINQREINQPDKEQEDYFRYVTPVWDHCVRSGAINLFRDEKYQQYLEIYLKIQYAQESEREWCHCKLMEEDCFRKRYADVLNNERRETATKIKGLIDKIDKQEKPNAVEGISPKRE